MSSVPIEETQMDVDQEPSSSSSPSQVSNEVDKASQHKPLKKVVHLCKSFQELQEKSKTPGVIYDKLTDENLAERAKNYFEKAEAMYYSGDEERAYIFYSYSLDADIELQSRSEVSQDNDDLEFDSDDDEDGEDEDNTNQQSSYPRQDHILQMLNILKDSLKIRYGNNWKQSDGKSLGKSSHKNQQQKKVEVNRKRIWKEGVLENESNSKSNIQLNVSSKDYAIQITQLNDTEKLLSKKIMELKIIENTIENLSKRDSEQSNDNVFKDFIPEDNKCQFGCYSVEGFVLGDNFVCKNGHRVCSRHKPKFPICPTCENEWLKLSENYFMSLERECPFAEKGCQEKVKLEEMEKHLDLCQWTRGNKQVLKYQWRKIITEAKIMGLEMKVKQEREIVEEMEEPLTKAGCVNAPLEILRQRQLELEMALHGEKNKVSWDSSS